MKTENKPTKKKYVKPVVKRKGSVAKITAKTGSTIDFGSAYNDEEF
jgi:hypothetical protein